MIINYPEVLYSIAKEISTVRTERIKKMVLGNKRSEKEFKEHNTIGVLGELIAQHFFIEQGAYFEATEILSNKPLIEADIFVKSMFNTRKIDVKTLKSSHRYLMVNQFVHENPLKDVNEYMFIQIIKKGQCKIWFYSHEDVDKWNIVEQTYSKVYAKKIS